MLGIDLLSIWTFSLQNSCHRIDAKIPQNCENNNFANCKNPGLFGSFPSLACSLRARSGRLTIRLVQFIVLRQPNKVYHGLHYTFRCGIVTKFYDISGLDFIIGRWKKSFSFFHFSHNAVWHLCLGLVSAVSMSFICFPEKTLWMASLHPAAWNYANLPDHLRF